MSKRVFIVRPFGTQQGVNFDRIEETLIRPALDRISAIGPEGGTTKEIIEQGNIREDMFRELVAADLVIADVSIHNANVFYELGIRHGLRPNATFLLRANVDTYPFDLQTDRYLAYDRDNPAQSLDELARALKATLESGRVDSPVYEVLPSLPPPDPAVLRVVPRDFREEVERAHRSDQRADLRLLAEEARTFSWSTEGLRTVGRAQFDLAAARGAKETFEWLREQRPEDVEANQRLATIYERLWKEDARQDYLALSNQAIQRVIDSLVPGSWDRAEAYALKARNIKSRWRQTFSGKTGADARVVALQAPELNEALESYASGFRQDLNHFYSGLNAMALLRIRTDLARALPDVWTSGFDTDDDARRELDDCAAQFAQLAAAVRLSLEAGQQSLDRRPDPDKQLWVGISTADQALLTANRPKAVAQRYREALAGAPRFAVDSVRQQLEFFAQLDVRTEFVKEVLPVVQELGGDQGPAAGRRQAARAGPALHRAHGGCTRPHATAPLSAHGGRRTRGRAHDSRSRGAGAGPRIGRHRRHLWRRVRRRHPVPRGVCGARDRIAAVPGAPSGPVQRLVRATRRAAVDRTLLPTVPAPDAAGSLRKPGAPDVAAAQEGLRHLATQQPVDAVQRTGAQREDADPHRALGPGEGRRSGRDGGSREAGRLERLQGRAAPCRAAQDLGFDLTEFDNLHIWRPSPVRSKGTREVCYAMLRRSAILGYVNGLDRFGVGG